MCPPAVPVAKCSLTARLSPLERVKLFLMLRHTFVDTGKWFNDRAGGLLEGKDVKFVQVFGDSFYRPMQDKRKGVPMEQTLIQCA
jgi:hypothetical protein